jgi:Zn-dependent protease
VIAGESAERCGDCHSEMPPGSLACPVCGRLVYASELKGLARAAEEAERASQWTDALSHWRRCLDLLPPGARQHRVIETKIRILSGRLGVKSDAIAGVRAEPPASPQPDVGPKSRWKAWLLALGPLGALLLKFKFALAFVLTKGKLLLLGFTKASTFFSMALSFGVYWKLWGWLFAAGLVGSIYVHEMGHVAALRRYGIKATAPMFIPGFGALVRMGQRPVTARENARVGLAGPIWGLGAAIACYATYKFTGATYWAGIARIGAWINLFNLAPVWQLDGSRAFDALSKESRYLALAALGLAWFFTAEGLLLLLLITAAGRTWFTPGNERDSDRGALLQFVLLVFALAALCLLPARTV